MNLFVRAGATGLLLSLLLAVPALAGPPVSVRVEGQSSTLLPRTPVTLTDAPEPNTGCAANSGSAAIELATNGNWDRQPFITTLLGEKHDFSNNDFWGIWVFRGGVYKVATGVCDERLAAGEELLAAIQFADPVTFAPKLFPLWIAGVPATAKPGVPFSVTVFRTACETAFCNPGEGHAVPAAGATVTATGGSATADANGVATLTLNGRGEITLKATLTDSIPSPVERSCLSDGVDGYCGYQLPPPPAPETDTTAPVVRITGLKRKYNRGGGPRTLTAAVEEANLADVKLAITRTRRGRCAGFGNVKGRFRKIRCGRRLLFSVGPKQDVSFLLPRRLGTGRYQFDVIAVDQSGNRDEESKSFRVR